MSQPIIPVRPVEGAERPAIPPTPRWVEALMLCALAAVAYGIMRVAAEWRSPLAPGVRVDLSPLYLPWYAALSTLRMAIAYVIALVFSLAYARIAAASQIAERFMLPVLDILQSIPILSFMAPVVLGLAALFPGRTLGLELASVVLIFTSQAWNLAFSFHQSLLTIPRELNEAATVYRLGFWQRFMRLELPFGVISLVANSMMSWAGGWFVLMFSEQFTMGGDKNFRLPGLGSYIAGAADAGNMTALLLGLATLITVIVLLDQILWRPLVAWSDRFKFEQSGGEAPTSAVLDAIRGSALVEWIGVTVLPRVRQYARRLAYRWKARRAEQPTAVVEAQLTTRLSRAVPIVVVATMVTLVLWGTWAAIHTLAGMPGSDWRLIVVSASATLVRTIVALVIAVAWTVPVGVAIGTDPRWARRAQPLVQIAASVPATAVFPVLLIFLTSMPGGLNIASVALMLLGTQWYVLFNVIAGAMAIPTDLKEAAVTYKVVGWRRWKTLIFPAIFPYLVTGMITATGGAWNASVVSEYVSFAGHNVSTVGLGALIAQAADKSQFKLLLASTFVMSAIVITVNRLVWRRLYTFAETRYRLD